MALSSLEILNWSIVLFLTWTPSTQAVCALKGTLSINPRLANTYVSPRACWYMFLCVLVLHGSVHQSTVFTPIYISWSFPNLSQSLQISSRNSLPTSAWSASSSLFLSPASVINIIPLPFASRVQHPFAGFVLKSSSAPISVK